MPTMYTLKDAAAQADCSVKTLRNRIKTGELRALMKDGKHGPTYFVPEAELVRMLAMEDPGGRTQVAPPAQQPTSTVPPRPVQGSSSQEADASTVAEATSAPLMSSDMLLRLTERIEQQATELGRYMAITERAESLESRERQLQADRDQLALELAETRARLQMLERERQQMLERERLSRERRWFGFKRKHASTLPSDAGQGYSSVEAGVS